MEKEKSGVAGGENGEVSGGAPGGVSGDAGSKPSTGERIIKGSFWIIAAIHIVAFSAIGIATREWRLLFIFLAGFAVTLAVWAGIKIAVARRKRKRG